MLFPMKCISINMVHANVVVKMSIKLLFPEELKNYCSKHTNSVLYNRLGFNLVVVKQSVANVDNKILPYAHLFLMRA